MPISPRRISILALALFLGLVIVSMMIVVERQPLLLVATFIRTREDDNMLLNKFDEEYSPSGLANRMELYRNRYSYHQPDRSSVPYSHPFPACGTNESGFQDFFQLSHVERSRMGEDKAIYQSFFQGRPPPIHATYVELGAYDGRQESNTRFFDHCLGWDGLLIEGNPISFENLLKNNRSSAHRMSFAPSCSLQDARHNNATVSFHRYPLTNSGVIGKAKTFDAKNWTYDVPCGPLTPILLDLFPHGHISFFSLDVEGSEPEVLENIDFSKVFIELLMVESQNNFCKQQCPGREKARRLLQGKGYVLYTNVIPKSDLYVHPKSSYQLMNKGSLRKRV